MPHNAMMRHPTGKSPHLQIQWVTMSQYGRLTSALRSKNHDAVYPQKQVTNNSETVSSNSESYIGCRETGAKRRREEGLGCPPLAPDALLRLRCIQRLNINPDVTAAELLGSYSCCSRAYKGV
jgi:hypothetical protein